MDLLTSIANEFDIPIIRKDQRVWFFRTRGGKYYYDFTTNSFIALGWDKISPAVISGNGKTKEGKKKYIEELYPDEKRPGLILSQMDVFIITCTMEIWSLSQTKGLKRSLLV